MNDSRLFNENKLIIASHNQNKINEIKEKLEPLGIHLLSGKDLNLAEPLENGSTYLENALIKARACVLATNLPALSDDSGVEVEALNFEPGLQTAPYTKEHGGLKNVFSRWASNPKIAANNAAKFVCVQVLFWPDGHYEFFEGVAVGKLNFPPRGNNGHGYDPVFIPNGYQKTVAEMTLEEKNICSHRYLALKGLIDRCIRPAI